MKTDPSSERLSWDRWLFALALTAIAVGAVNAVTRFPDQFDFLSYHLPSSLQIFHATTFMPYDYLAEMIAGHPPAAHAVIGALVVSTGLVSAATLLGVIAFASWLGGIWWLTRDARQVRWSALTALALPLLVLHLYVPYIDLWTGAWLALAVFAAVRSVHGRLGAREAVVFCVGTSLAALSKFQAWPPIAVLWLWASAHWIQGAWVRRTQSRRLVGFTLALSATLVAIWPVRNVLRHGNPTHPWPAPVVSRLFHPTGYVNDTSPPGNQHPPAFMTGLPSALQFSASVLELGRWQMPSVRYTYDMWNDVDPRKPHHLSGGWGIWTVLLLTWWWVHWWRTDRRARSTLGLFLALAIVVAVLPLSFTLRFWFFLPLGAIACLSHFDFAFVRARPWAVLLCLALTVAHTGAQVVSTGAESQAVATPASARLFWQHARRDLLYVPPSEATAIFWAGSDFNTFHLGPGGAPWPPEMNNPR